MFDGFLIGFEDLFSPKQNSSLNLNVFRPVSSVSLNVWVWICFVCAISNYCFHRLKLNE